MEIWFYLLGALGIAVLLLAIVCFLVWPGKSTAKQREVFYGLNIAHRGLHNKDGMCPENSLAAFEAAAAAGYGIELDLQLSQDDEVVVFHDDGLARVCGIKKNVRDVPWADLQKMRLQKSDETIPSFVHTLKLVGGRVPLVVELKTCKDYPLLCKKAWGILQNYQGEYCIESFDPRIVAWFKKNAPEVFRGQLVNAVAGYGDAVQGFVLGNLMCNFLARAQFVAHSTAKHSLLVRLVEKKAMRIAWTVRPKNNISAIEGKTDAVIFEFYTPELHFKGPSAKM